jgi:hypothetical protein
VLSALASVVTVPVSILTSPFRASPPPEEEQPSRPVRDRRPSAKVAEAEEAKRQAVAGACTGESCEYAGARSRRSGSRMTSSHMGGVRERTSAGEEGAC